MPLGASEHHVIGPIVAKRLPLHHILRESGKGAFPACPSPK
jgi:hypothetical protein